MATNVLVDSGFLVAILAGRDSNHTWAITVAERHPPPWATCEAVLSEVFYLLGRHGAAPLMAILRRDTLLCPFQFQGNATEVLALMHKYADVPMSFADACLVRMTETLADPVLLTADTDFRVYRRHSRQAIPCIMPS